MWFIFALSNALAESFKDVFGKKGADRFDARTRAWAQHLFAACLLLPLAAVVVGAPSFDRTFWLAAGGSLAINAVTSILYMRALALSPLSLVAPIVTLTPVFLLITSPLINREFPSLLGIIGVLVSVVGAYFLNAGERTHGWFAPFTALVRDRGSRAMLLVALMWSVSAPLDKVAVQHSSPLWYTAIINVSLALVLLPLVIRGGRIRRVMTASGLRTLCPIGIMSGISVAFQMTALSMTLVPYVIGVKRTSGLFGIIWGKLLFKETKIRERLLGAAIIVVGALFILWATK